MNITTIQSHFERLKSNKIFEWTVITLIIFSALVVGAKTYDIDSKYNTLIAILDWSVTLFFLIEVIIRLLAEPRTLDFFKKGWNVFDFIIVVISLIPIQDSETVLLARIIRVFRVLRLISVIPELKILINALLKSLPPMAYVLLLMFVIFYIYAAIGSFLFENINPVLWENVTISMLTLFRVVTFEDWTDVMYETMEVYRWSWVYYLSFIFLNAFVFLNMMIGIVIDRMQSEHAQYDLDEDVGEASDIKHIREQTEEILERLSRMEERNK